MARSPSRRANLGVGIEDVPGIMRVYCDGHSCGPASHNRLVANSPIKNSQTPVQALRHRKTTIGKDGSKQRNVRLPQLFFNLSGHKASCLIGGQHKRQPVTPMGNVCSAPGYWTASQNGEIELRLDFSEARYALVAEVVTTAIPEPDLARDDPKTWCDRPTGFDRARGRNL